MSNSTARPRTHRCSENYVLRDTEMFFKCDRCKMKGFGERLTCRLCRTSRIHRECWQPRERMSHENFPGSNFIFKSTPSIRRDDNSKAEYTKLCNICGKDICGYSYQCKEDNLDIHPCCGKLENKLMIKLRDDKIMILDLAAKVSSKCVKCGKRKIESKVQGWSYVSVFENKKYTFHVFCLNEIIEEAFKMRDNLKLGNLDSTEIVRLDRNMNGENTFVTCVKLVLKILMSALLGDPTTLFSGAMVDLFFRHLS